MLSSGLAGFSTSEDGWLMIIPPATDRSIFRHVAIMNEGGVPGFFSIDGGTTPARLSVGSTVLDDISVPAKGVVIMRDPATKTDLAGIYAFAY